jgi:hypothetical protein
MRKDAVEMIDPIDNYDSIDLGMTTIAIDEIQKLIVRGTEAVDLLIGDMLATNEYKEAKLACFLDTLIAEIIDTGRIPAWRSPVFAQG